MTGFQGEWHDARAIQPADGQPVAAAMIGRHRSRRPLVAGRFFWMVRPMVFSRLHLDGAGGQVTDCFVDSDGVVRGIAGSGTDEEVTHWTSLPSLPGTDARELAGRAALRALDRATGRP